MTSVLPAAETSRTLNDLPTSAVQTSSSGRTRTLSPKILNLDIMQLEAHEEALSVNKQDSTIHKEECEQTQVTSPTTVEDEDYEIHSTGSSLHFSSREISVKDLCSLSNSPPQDSECNTKEGGVHKELASLDLTEHATLKTHGSTAPVIKPYDLADVPLKQKKNTWLSLKPPTGDAHLRLSRSKSVPSQDLPSTKERRVRFLAVHIREYSQTIGDNPSVSYGPPISLDWNYNSTVPVPLDDYEANRGKRRTLRQMMLNYYHRTNLLQHVVGASEKDIHAAQKAAEKVKGQRAMTKALLGMSKIEEAWQSTKRKGKLFGKKRPEKKQ